MTLTDDTEAMNGRRGADDPYEELRQADAEGRPPMNMSPKEEATYRLIQRLDVEAVNGNDVGDLPPAKIIVPELGITEKSTVEIFGKMKSGKTFFTLDLACSMAAGADWRGHHLTACRVLYLIGEGTPGLGSRVRAWKYDRGVDNLERLIFQPTRLSLTREEDYWALLTWVKARGPFGMVVLDTLARYAVGSNENTSDMRTVIDRAESIRDAASAEAPVIVVHHSGRGSQDHGRGDSGVEAACDLIVRTTKDGNKMAAEIMDGRHAPEGHILRSTLEPVPEARETGEDHDPVVIVPDLAPSSTFLPDSRRALLDALETIVDGDGWAAAGKWQDVSEMPAATFYRAKKDLIGLGYVEVDDKGRYPRFRPMPAKPDSGSDQEF